ncbi:MAG TPA: MFS transporter [Stellaceae bacterium]|nr:MFS transporter [Stellaceae bacterium]
MAAWRLLLLWLIGVQLRLTVLAVPPVLPLIHRDLALSEKAVGALSALPVLLLAAGAVPGSLTVARLGARRACLLGLAIVAAAGAARGIGASAAVLFAMTFAMGGGVALMQPTLPSLVGSWFADRPGFATAIYANGLLIGEALPPAATLPLVLPWVGGSWGLSLAAWSAPAALTALLLAATPSRPAPAEDAAPARWWPDWRRAAPWQLGLLLGGTGGAYFCANTFIPDYLHAIGAPALVGPCLGAINIGQLPASLVILAFARQLTGNRLVFLVSPLGALAGLAAFIAAPPTALGLVAAAGLLGFCCGMQLILSLALPPLLAPAGDVHRISAAMFAIGYGVSCLVPPLGGAIWDASGAPAAAFAAVALSLVAVIATAATLPALSTARAGSAPRR